MNLNVIRRLTVKGEQSGLPELARGLDKVAQAQDNLAKSSASAATVTETSAKRQLSMGQALERNERRFNASLRAQQDFEKVQRQMNAAVAQNPALQDRANDVIARARVHFDQTTKSQQLFSRGLQAANDNLQSFAMRAGPVGSVLASFGPLGIVAAAGIGVLVLGLYQAASAALALADRAGKMVDFAETTGLTTTQLQALQKAAAFVGIDIDKVGTGFERFSVQMEELRRGTGGLFEAMNRIDPALTNQLATTRDLGDAWDIFSAAIRRADRDLGNAAAKAAFGRSGVPFTRLAGATVDAGGIAGLEAALGRVNVLTAEQLKRWDELKDKIDHASKTARDNVISIFADDALSSQLAFYTGLLRLSQLAKDFEISKDLKSLLLPTISGASGGLAIGVLIAALNRALQAARELRNRSPAGTGGGGGWGDPGPAETGDSFSSRFGPWSGGVKTKEEFDIARMRQRVEILGAAAGATLRLSLAEAELAQKAKLAGVSQEDLARGIDALRLDHQITLMQQNVTALGSSATVTEQYGLAVAQLAVQLQRGQISQETFNRATAALRSDQHIQGMRDTTAALGDLASPMQQYELRVAELQKQLDQGRISQETFNAAVKAADPVFQGLTNAMSGFVSSMAQGFAQGKGFAENFRSSLQGVSNALTDIGSKELSGGFKNILAGKSFGADPTSLAIGAIGIGVGIVAKMMGDNAELKKAKDAWAGMADQVRDFNEAARGVNLQPATQALRQALATATTLYVAAMKANDWAGAATVAADWATMVNRTLTEFQVGLPVLDEFGQKLKDAIDAAAQMADEIDRVGHAITGEEQAKIAEGLKRIAQQIGADFTADLQSKINEALGKGYLNQIGALVTERQKQLASIDALRAQGVNVDPALIDRYFAVQAQKIIDDANLVGTAFDDLVTAFSPLAGVVHESTAAIAEQIEEQKRLADQMNVVARSILDYVNNLLGGSQSSLSPSARLAAAQTTYGSTLGLAQGGNIDALGRITQDFENVRTAAQAMFASGSQYQAILNQGLSELTGLPAITASDDPIVVALRETIAPLLTGIQTHTLDTATGVADLTLDFNGDGIISAIEAMQGALTIAVNSGSAAAIALALSTHFDALNTTADAGLTFSEFVAGVAPLSKDITVGSLLTQEQLDSVGLATNTTVAGLLTAAELLAGLGPLSKETTVGGLLTPAQLAAAGLATNANLYQVEGQTNLVRLALMQSGGVRDWLMDVFKELDGNGNGILEKSELIKAATQGTVTSTNTTAGNTGEAATLLDILTTQFKGQVAVPGSGTTATNEVWTRDANGIWHRTEVATTASTAGVLSYPDQFINRETLQGRQVLPGILNNSLLEALNKIVFNTFAIAHNTAVLNFAGLRPHIFGTFAQGGTAQPFSNAIFGEHHPSGPFAMRTGSEPVTFSPGLPQFANGNGQIVSMLERLIDQNDRFARDNHAQLAQIAKSEERNVESTDINTSDRREQMDRSRQDDRMRARKRVA